MKKVRITAIHKACYRHFDLLRFHADVPLRGGSGTVRQESPNQQTLLLD